MRDYLPEIHQLELTRAPRIDTLVQLLGGAEVEVVPVPWDCTDGFQAAYWRRPERYFDPKVLVRLASLACLGAMGSAPRAYTRVRDLSGADSELHGRTDAGLAARARGALAWLEARPLPLLAALVLGTCSRYWERGRSQSTSVART